MSSPFLPPVPNGNTAIHFTYLCDIVIEYIVTIVTLDHLRVRMASGFLLLLLIHSSVSCLSLCRSEFLAFIIFLLSEELLLWWSLSLALSEKVFTLPSLSKGNFTGCRLLAWLIFFFQHFNCFTPLSSCVWFLTRSPMWLIIVPLYLWHFPASHCFFQDFIYCLYFCSLNMIF